MASDYAALLEATITHLESLKRSGRRHVRVNAALLLALEQPIKTPSPGLRPAAPTPVRPSAVNADVPVAVVPSFDSEQRAEGKAKAAAMEELRQRALICQKCPHLVQSRTQVVFGVGSVDAEVMFVGEAPGADEDRQGEPFVGKAGQLLTRIIQTMGLSRETVYIANILKCRPDTPGQSFGNRKPTTDEMGTCIPYLHEQIDLIRPKVLVALGATAMEGLLGKGGGITKLRGQWHEYRDIPLMPTYHPAFLLRNQALGEKRKVWEDMLSVMERLGLPITEKHRGYFLKGRE